ncbi:MAG: c-type cytochrome [Nitrospirae bacterium]|nr:MAG: c-type cytochrome [Nitrospirota bacterium]
MTRKPILSLALVCAFVIPAAAAEQHMMAPRVPADKLAEARALQSPLPNSPDVVEKGKALYEGKGTCVNCHGTEGRGDGIASIGLDPSPRNFHHHGFWRHRTEGEIFWVIKNGSVGTSMIGFAGQLADEEIWTIMQYERSFAGEHGPGMMGPGGGRDGMEPRGPRGGMGPRGECCQGQ